MHGVCSGPGDLASKGGIACGLPELLALLAPFTHAAATAADGPDIPGPAADVVNARDARGRTPLHVACCRPHAHARHGMEGCCVGVLLEAGGRADALDGGGRTPLHWVLGEAAKALRLREADQVGCLMPLVDAG